MIGLGDILFLGCSTTNVAVNFQPLTNQNARNAMLCRRITIHLSLFCAISSSLWSAFAADLPTLPIVKNVELQPFVAQVRRVIEATDYLGSPLSAADRK